MKHKIVFAISMLMIFAVCTTLFIACGESEKKFKDDNDDESISKIEDVLQTDEPDKIEMSNVLQTAKTYFEEIYALDYYDGTLDGMNKSLTSGKYLVVVAAMLDSSSELYADYHTKVAGMAENQVISVTDGTAIYVVESEKLVKYSYTDKDNKYTATYTAENWTVDKAIK